MLVCIQLVAQQSGCWLLLFQSFWDVLKTMSMPLGIAVVHLVPSNVAWCWCRQWTLHQLLINCVLPLAGPSSGRLWKSRFAGPTELCQVACALGVHMRIWDVETKVFMVTVGPVDSPLSMSVLSTGDHFELVYV